MDSVYVVIPAYNEEENLRELIKEWYPVVKKHHGDGRSRLVIVNDGSTDNTKSILEDEKKNRPLLKVINKKNGGHGSALLCGYGYAIRKQPDYVFQTDSDRQTLPSQFEGFWRKRREYDAIIGKREGRQDGFDRVVVNRTLRMFLFFIFGKFIPDANTPFRLMGTDILREGLEFVGSREKLPNIMLSVVFAFKKKNVLYKKITFRERQGGKNSLNIKKIAKLGIEGMKRFFILKGKLCRDRDSGAF